MYPASHFLNNPVVTAKPVWHSEISTSFLRIRHCKPWCSLCLRWSDGASRGEGHPGNWTTSTSTQPCCLRLRSSGTQCTDTDLWGRKSDGKSSATSCIINSALSYALYQFGNSCGWSCVGVTHVGLKHLIFFFQGIAWHDLWLSD